MQASLDERALAEVSSVGRPVDNTQKKTRADTRAVEIFIQNSNQRRNPLAERDINTTSRPRASAAPPGDGKCPFTMT